MQPLHSILGPLLTSLSVESLGTEKSAAMGVSSPWHLLSGHASVSADDRPDVGGVFRPDIGGILARCHKCFNWQHVGSFQQMVPFYFLIIFN